MARTNHALAWQTIDNAIFSAWDGLDVQPCALVPENTDATPPDPAENWARVHIRPAETTNMALGRDFLRGVGVVMVQIFIRKGGGALAAQVIADALSLLTNTQLAGIPEVTTLVVTLRATGPATFVGTDPVGGWSLWMFEIPYHWDSQDQDAATIRVTQSGDQRLTQDGKIRIIN